MLKAYKDYANLITISGLILTVFSIYLSIAGLIPLAAIVLLWAETTDWWDGIVARATTQRNATALAMGKELDSFSDFVAGGIGTGVLLLAVGNWSAWFLPAAIAIALSTVTRLAYFNAFGMATKDSFLGFPAAANITVICTVYLLCRIWNGPETGIIVMVATLACSALNVGQFLFPKFSGIRAASIFTAYSVLLTLAMIVFIN